MSRSTDRISLITIAIDSYQGQVASKKEKRAGSMTI